MCKKNVLILWITLFVGSSCVCLGQAQRETYLQSIKLELQKQWPENRTINLVFHGHSVPSGYFVTPSVQTLNAYPNLVLKKLKELYPNAVINTITTSIGGENSLQGAKRFDTDVLIHKPDVLFIDYALNDRGIGLEQSKIAMEEMIKTALERNIKVILMTPSPDLRVDITKKDNELELFANMLTELAATWGIGLGDSYGQFKALALRGTNLNGYMAQVNHPNEKGHELIAETILNYFK